jgi:hypothetical protein
MSESRPPDDTPTRLLGSPGNVGHPGTTGEPGFNTDRELIQWLRADVSRLQQENALLRRSLEMLTKQLDEKDERITELTFTIIRANSPA